MIDVVDARLLELAQRLTNQASYVQDSAPIQASALYMVANEIFEMTSPPIVSSTPPIAVE